ncbi:YdeI/OmpD-associated family protein [Epilithonimonas hungarica]|uniref:YdeI/OmpD-associated family protein n=1 Tax=Epilithonimonas hungarica TaxID=454006 RepID=UPI0027D8C583|nr:YdeI/OmpD-associated family protein [Epilithonimonas hungarica]
MDNKTFSAKLDIIGINPFVFVPENILAKIFEVSGKNKSPISVKGKVNGADFTQTLVKYSGEWRLYINLKMLENSPKRIGETLEIELEFDNSERTELIHPELKKAIYNNPITSKNFENLNPYHKKELIRYINNLKTEKSVVNNIAKIIRHLNGEIAFFGRKIK